MVHGERKPFVNSSTVCEQKIQLDNRTRSARPHVIYSPILLSSSLQCPPMSTFLYIYIGHPGHHPHVHSSTSYLTPMSTHVHLPLYIITGSWTSPLCTFVDILPHTHVHSCPPSFIYYHRFLDIAPMYIRRHPTSHPCPLSTSPLFTDSTKLDSMSIPRRPRMAILSPVPWGTLIHCPFAHTASIVKKRATLRKSTTRDTPPHR